MRAKYGLLPLFLALSAGIHATEVNFLNWAQYIGPQVIPKFEKRTGIQVNQSFFNGADMLKAKLLAGGTGYDVIMPALADMPQYLHADLLQPIDKSKLPNYKHRNKTLYQLTAKIDPQNRYGVIYTYGTTGIAYNAKLIRKYLGKDAPVHSWKILFDPKYLKKLQHCGISFLDEPTQVFGITLNYLGYNPNTQDPKQLEAAANYLMKIRHYLTYFGNNRYQYDLASGNLCIAMGYSGDTLHSRRVAQSSGDNVDVRYALANDGVPIWFDMMAVPKNAPHPKAALTFINAMIAPKAAAAISNRLQQPNATPASEPYLDKTLQQPSATPTASLLKHAFILHDPTPKTQALVSQLWFKVRYGVNLNGSM